MKAAIPAMLILACFNANAEIYKCIDAKNKTTYSETPCGANAEYLVIEDNTIGSSNLRAKAKEMWSEQPESINNQQAFMNSYDVQNRIRELEIDLKSRDSSNEKMMACKHELAILKRDRVKILSYENEKKRSNAMRSLNSMQVEVRKRGLKEIYEIFNHY